MKKSFLYLILILSIIFGVYSFADYNIKNNTKTYIYLKNKIPKNIKKNIREKIQTMTRYLNKDEIVLENLKDINNEKLGVIKIYNNKLFNFTGPRAYLGSNENNLFIMTGSGILFYGELSKFNQNKDIKIKKIQTNILEIFDNYKIDNTDELEEVTMVKSILVHNEKVYFSATVKINEKCFKQKIFKSDLNLKKMNFEEFFQIRDCRTFYNNTSGGNITVFKDNKILYTLGDWKSCQYLDKYPKNFCTEKGPQNLKSSLGKIMMIDLDNKKSKYLSLGHNNPQGITYNKTKDVIFSAEHGPQGGDEVNANDLSKNDVEIKNFGWPLASYGEHYGYPADDIEYLYEMAPLLKSHKENGFVEPLDYFVPSIGISDIENYQNNLFVASMGDNSKEGDLTLYIYELDNDNNITNKKSVLFNQRIRDLHIVGQKLFMFLESTGTISVINLNNLNLT